MMLRSRVQGLVHQEGSVGRRLLPLVAVLVVALTTAAGALPAVTTARAVPVKCAAGDVTPDGRVFPEPRVSLSFVQFHDFECGIALLEATFPDKIDVTVIGESKAGHPVYNVLVTDETVEGDKEKLLVVNSIHGNEIGAREGGIRSIEDLVDPRFLADEDWVRQVLSQYVIHFLFPNPDGWVNGDVWGTEGAGVAWTRGNGTGRDLNRNFPVSGWINTANAPLAEPESRAVVDNLFNEGGWYLGTDNHGQLTDTFMAAGLQIVGQFDYQKSETLARFADAIADGMAEYVVLSELRQIEQATGLSMGPYRWGTLYDILGYSASGSMIDYYNTFDGVAGTGFATELTMSNLQASNALLPIQLVNQVWVDSIRGINYTMFRQAIDRQDFTFPVGSRAAYVFDPKVQRHTDLVDPPEGQAPYAVTRMRFFADLNLYAERELPALRVADVVADPGVLDAYDSLVLANDAMPEHADDPAAAEGYHAALRDWVAAGGNLVLTDGAVRSLPRIDERFAPADVSVAAHYVGFVNFTDRSHTLNVGLRGVASQTYDTVPIGYRFGGSNSAPNWKVRTAAWEAAGGTTVGTNGSGQTIYGEVPLGQGRIRFLGALLPDPSQEFFHPYGLQNYAVTYTGYTLLANMLVWDRP
jgi:hypothetical protein